MTFSRSLVALVLFSFLAVSAAHGQTLGAVLTGSQEVPPTTTPGFGNTTVTFNDTRTQITVTLTVANLGSPINNFHIHEEAAGANGPVRVDLIGLGGAFNNGTMTGTFPIAADVAARMLANPQNFYVNVHTNAFPGGAIRGQLAYVSGGTVTYAADLRSSNEVPPVNSNAYGSAFVTFDLTNNTIAWDVATNGIANPSLSHIHRGAAGSNGPVIINFATSASAIAGGRTSGSGTIASLQTANLTPADLAALANPATASGYYVNVHSTASPTGEVRGQLVAANEYDIPIAGHVVNGLGQTFVTDVRVFNPSYVSSANALVELLPAGAAGNTTAVISKVVSIPPRGTAALDDVTGSAFLNVPGVLGALRVTSASQLVVTSRIYNDQRGSNRGTLGQFAPAIARGAGLRHGVLPQLAQDGDPSSGFRTNVGFFNPNPSPVTVRLELRDEGGTVIGQTTLTLVGLSQQQTPLASLFASVEHGRSGTMTLSFDAAAPIVAYAAVNDNVSGDSFFVVAQADVGVAANQ